MMRVGEIVNLKWTSIDMTRKLIHVQNQFDYRLKTPYPHAVPMNAWVFTYLDAQDDREGHVFSRANGDPLTRNYVSRLFCRFSRKAGLDKGLHFHSLRHSGASWLVQNGVPLYEVQKLLGHRSIITTQMYAHLAPSELHATVDKIVVT